MTPDYIVNTELGDLIIETAALTQSSCLIDQLVAIRKEKKLTQQDIADASGMCRANIARIERKKYAPTLDVLMRYANCLGYDVKLSLEPQSSPASSQS